MQQDRLNDVYHYARSITARRRRTIVAAVADALNGADITWGVCASALIALHVAPRDLRELSIVVEKADLKAAMRVLTALGRCRYPMPMPGCAFERYAVFDLTELTVSLICGMTLRSGKMICRYAFDAGDVAAHMTWRGAVLPLCALEDWYVLYLLMPDCARQTNAIERHWKVRGLHSPARLADTARQIRGDAADRIEWFLNVFGEGSRPEVDGSCRIAEK